MDAIVGPTTGMRRSRSSRVDAVCGAVAEGVAAAGFPVDAKRVAARISFGVRPGMHRQPAVRGRACSS